jgi:hypothetical protein
VAVIPDGSISIQTKCLGNCTPAAAVDVLGSVSKFALFTSGGAVTNTLLSGIVGDIGSESGIISGFGSSTHVGSVYNANAITAQAKIDLDRAYNSLMALLSTVSHAAAFGAGETLNAGVYHIVAAGSLGGTIILDGQNNPDAIFVFRFGGAFSVAAGSKVIFTNGTCRCNVFWIGGAGVATGAVTIGASVFMKGTVISHGGAVGASAGSNVVGRMLSTAGAITFSKSVIYQNKLCFGDDIPISGGDQTVCYDGNPSQALTATATANPNSPDGVISWYDAATAGNVVDPPSQVGVGTVTHYAESFNGTYASDTRIAVTLAIDAGTSAPTASVTAQPTCTTPSGTIVVTAPIPAGNITYTVTGTSPVVAGVT